MRVKREMAIHSVEDLCESTKSHITDVQDAMYFFTELMDISSSKHDHTKLRTMEEFYEYLGSGFQGDWFKKHKLAERHHINSADGVRDDVNLIDVLEHISDCVMAGTVRSGYVYDLKLSDELLQKAFQNTVALLKKNVEIIE